MNNGRKIGSHIENPVDDLLIKIAEKVSPPLVKIGVTPNFITTLSFISGLLSVYFLWKDQYLASGLLFLLGYFFDCMDGHIARKFNMITKFGDLYDHFTDIAISILLFIVFLRKKTTVTFKVVVLAMIVLFVFLAMVHLGCQEKHYELINKHISTNGILYRFTSFCKSKEMIHTTKFFGMGTYTIVIMLVIIFTPQLQKFL